MPEQTPSNPFRFGDLALDDAFTDRQVELQALKSDIRNGQNVAIIAPRRFGKSSLVRRATQDLLAEGVLVVEVDLMSTPSKEKLAAKLAKSIHDDVATVLFKAKERLRVFATLRVVPVITINPDDGAPSFSFSTSQSATRRSSSSSTSSRRSRASTRGSPRRCARSSSSRRTCRTSTRAASAT
jgi:hypothetical protein